MNVSGTLAATIVWVSDHCEWRLGGIFFLFRVLCFVFFYMSLFVIFIHYSYFFFILFIFLFFVGLFGRPLVRLSDCLDFLSE